MALEPQIRTPDVRSRPSESSIAGGPRSTWRCHSCTPAHKLHCRTRPRAFHHYALLLYIVS
ncbi:hypothetical protein J6590_061485 [Homalodisca vitripennis]|nr:hypothetical protein J6590_061485 [Homalodisca vitripennis]